MSLGAVDARAREASLNLAAHPLFENVHGRYGAQAVPVMVQKPRYALAHTGRARGGGSGVRRLHVHVACHVSVAIHYVAWKTRTCTPCIFPSFYSLTKTVRWPQKSLNFKSKETARRPTRPLNKPDSLKRRPRRTTFNLPTTRVSPRRQPTPRMPHRLPHRHHSSASPLAPSSAHSQRTPTCNKRTEKDTCESARPTP